MDIFGIFTRSLDIISPAFRCRKEPVAQGDLFIISLHFQKLHLALTVSAEYFHMFFPFRFAHLSATGNIV